jgi:Flp pilus assembly protein TadG
MSQRVPSVTASCSKRRRFENNISGAAAIEFAIVLTIFIMIVLGILAYGIYFGAAHGVSQLAADAARASVAGLSDTERSTLAKDHVERNAGDFLLLSPEKIAVAAAASPNDANQFRVIVTYDAGSLPIWFMSGLVPLPSKTIVRSASIKRGGY